MPARVLNLWQSVHYDWDGVSEQNFGFKEHCIWDGRFSRYSIMCLEKSFR